MPHRFAKCVARLPLPTFQAGAVRDNLQQVVAVWIGIEPQGISDDLLLSHGWRRADDMTEAEQRRLGITEWHPLSPLNRVALWRLGISDDEPEETI